MPKGYAPNGSAARANTHPHTARTIAVAICFITAIYPSLLLSTVLCFFISISLSSFHAIAHIFYQTSAKRFVAKAPPLFTFSKK
jgi:hypothetical protein